MFVCVCFVLYLCRDVSVDLAGEKVYLHKKCFEICICLGQSDHPVQLMGC